MGKITKCTCGKSKRCIETKGRNRLISLALQPMCHCHSFQKHSEVHPASNVSNDQSFGQVEKKTLEYPYVASDVLVVSDSFVSVQV